MTSKIVTMTSKNQITLPVEMVRKLKLTKNRRLTVTQTGTGVILKVQPSLEEAMKKHWDKFHRTHPNFHLTSEQIHNEVGDTYEEYFKNGGTI